MLIDRRPQAALAAEQSLVLRAAGETTRDPHPRDEPEAQLKGTGPIHAHWTRDLLQPRLELSSNELGEALVAVDGVGCGRAHQVLMPVELPDVPHIANESRVPEVHQ